ncbi:MAG: hypothetical protein LW650_05970 [Planctomycetaceae bacterium]|nr:hypothetical protein [Planctomycetaceae bacterium]
MSEQPPTGNGGGEAPANPAMVVRRRPASVALRSGEEGGQSLMDPANQSLADALKITYRLLQLAMLGLLAMFVFSGFQSVQTGERGIRVAFGAVQTDDLPPGFQFSLPRPLGEILKVNTGSQVTSLQTEFMPALSDADRNRNEQELAGMGKDTLDPSQDNSLLTADNALAHARVSATWQRTAIRDNARNIDPEFERQIVSAAVRRGVVHAVAQVTIDEFLRNQPDPGRVGPFPTLETEARRIAQDLLDRNKAGIELRTVTFEKRLPPLRLIGEFANVERSRSEAGQAIRNAEVFRTERLTQAAGEAAPIMLREVDAFDAALASGKQDAATSALQRIDAILGGEPIDIDGQKVTVPLSGDAAGRIADALQYRSTTVSRAQADSTVFAAKLAAWRANPSVLMTSDWTEAFSSFIGRDSVQVFWVPPGVKVLDLLVNRDPALTREQERKRNEAAVKEREERRVRELEEAERTKYRNLSTPTGQ